MKYRESRIVGALLVFCLAIAVTRAEPAKATAGVTPLRADRMFSDHMILQRDMPVPIWGTAAPGQTIEVSIRDQKKTAKADADGKWLVKLDPLKVGDPATLNVGVAGANATITFTDVLVGEVWIGTGQSNMDGQTAGSRKEDEVMDAWAKDTDKMPLRVYIRDKGVWQAASGEAVDRFSALGFAFIYSLSKELGVPVGMMVVACGGRPSGEWITPEMAAASTDSVLRKLVAGGTEATPTGANQGGQKFLTRETMGVQYLRWISKFRPYAIRGVLWDQGEAGTNIEGVDQFTAMTTLITGWRRDWGQGAFPFLHMQKPSGGGCAWDPADPVNRKAVAFAVQPGNPSQMSADKMRYTLAHIRMGTITNAPLVTTMDLAPGMHPPTKSAYGARACRVALGAVYGRNVQICGPVYRSHKVEGDSIRVTFNHAGKGLAFRHGDKLQGFEIAGADGKWNWAEATIFTTTGAGQVADTVVVRNGSIPSPKFVRYAYNPTPNYANLFNQDGLPALTFTTENLGKDPQPSRGMR